jgi:hypothetical protein
MLEELNYDIEVSIPTYDGSGQTVHPDIIYFPNQKYGYHFYLAITPYYNGDDDYENPSLFVSNNGVYFKPFDSSTNPIVEFPGGSKYNNDPDVFYLEDSSKFYMFYQETNITEDNPYQHLNLLSSSDGVEWDNQIVADEDFLDMFSLSPSFIEFDETYHLFYVDIRGGYYLRYLESGEVDSWNFDAYKNVEFLNFDPLIDRPWHVDVFKGEDEYFYMLLSALDQEKEGNENLTSLFLGRSKNLVQWEFIKEPIIKYDDLRLKIYRSTGVIDGENLYIWYSYQTFLNDWFTNVKKVKMSDLLWE